MLQCKKCNGGLNESYKLNNNLFRYNNPDAYYYGFAHRDRPGKIRSGTYGNGNRDISRPEDYTPVYREDAKKELS